MKIIAPTILIENFAQEEVSKYMEESVIGDSSKNSGKKKGGSKKKKRSKVMKWTLLALVHQSLLENWIKVE
jgi:hypothetical protein